jgi:hypothetical protein
MNKTVAPTTNHSPETALTGLNRRLRRLLSAAAALRNEAATIPNLESQLLKAYRKTAIAELFHEKFMIAIAGMQGVGKTTLLRQLYGIPDGYLPENIGRGEKLPILITEYEGSTIETRLLRAERESEENGFVLKEESVSQEQFITAARQPSDQVMWLELKVPYRHFYSSDKSFVLLPGIEEAKDEREKEWQLFVQYALTLSTTCVLVFDKTKLAQGVNQRLLDSVIREFKTARPIFALSFSDERSGEENEQLKRLVLDKFSVSTDESDRVIPVGTGEMAEKWIEPFMAAIHSYSAIPREFRRNQIRHLNEQLMDLTLILNELDTVLRQHDVRTEIQNDTDYNTYFSVYDKAAKALRARLERQIQITLESHQGDAVKIMQNQIKDKNLLKKTRQFVFGQSYNDHFEFIEAIQQAWEQPYPNDSEGQARFVSIKCSKQIEMIIQERLQFYSESVDEENPFLLTAPSTLNEESEGFMDIQVKKQLIDNLSEFFTDDQKIVVLERDSIELVPIIAMERLNQSLIISQLDVYRENNLVRFQPPSTDLMDQIKSVRIAPGAIINGMAVVFGLDAIDGTINTVPALLSALGVPATTAAISIAGSLCGLLTLGFVAGNVARQMTKQDFNEEDAAITIIRAFREKYKQTILDHYDDLVLDARDRLERRLHIRTRKQESFVRWEKLRYTLRDVQEYQSGLQGRIYDHLGFMG